MNNLPKIFHNKSIKDNLLTLNKYVKKGNYLCFFLKNKVELNEVDKLKLTNNYKNINLDGINDCTIIISRKSKSIILDTHLILYPQHISLVNEHEYNTNKIENILQSFETYRKIMSGSSGKNNKVAKRYFDIVKAEYNKNPALNDLRNYCNDDKNCKNTVCCKGEEKYYLLINKSFNKLSDLFFIYALKKSSESNFHRKCSNWSNKIVLYDSTNTDEGKINNYEIKLNNSIRKQKVELKKYNIHQDKYNISIEKFNNSIKELKKSQDYFNQNVKKINNMNFNQQKAFKPTFDKIKSNFEKKQSEFEKKKSQFEKIKSEFEKKESEYNKYSDNVATKEKELKNFKLLVEKKKKDGTYIPENWFVLRLILVSPEDTSNQNKRFVSKDEKCNLDFFDFKNKKEISYKINFIIKIINFYRRKKTKRYLVLSLSFLNHSNRILIDMKNKRITRIEPHGFGSSTFYNTSQLNCLIKKLLVDKLPNFEYMNNELTNNDIPIEYKSLFNNFTIQGTLPLCELYSAYLQLLSIHYSKYTIISLNQIVSKMNISDRIINFYKLYMDFLNVYLQVNSDAIIKKYNLPKKKLVHEWIQGDEPDKLNPYLDHCSNSTDNDLCYQKYGFFNKSKYVKLTRKKLKNTYGLLNKSKKCIREINSL